MLEYELAFSHTFTGPKLGFSIAVARYGREGRMFVEVDETFPNCECYPDELKPTDELIAINDRLILEPRAEDVHDIKEAIAASERPLKLTFIQGENRDQAFRAQEAKRALPFAAPEQQVTITKATDDECCACACRF